MSAVFFGFLLIIRGWNIILIIQIFLIVRFSFSVIEFNDVNFKGCLFLITSAVAAKELSPSWGLEGFYQPIFLFHFSKRLQYSSLNGFILFENFWSLDIIYSVEICMLTEIEIGFSSWRVCINEPMKLNLNSNRHWNRICILAEEEEEEEWLKDTPSRPFVKT